MSNRNDTGAPPVGQGQALCPFCDIALQEGTRAKRAGRHLLATDCQDALKQQVSELQEELRLTRERNESAWQVADRLAWLFFDTHAKLKATGAGTARQVPTDVTAKGGFDERYHRVAEWISSGRPTKGTRMQEDVFWLLDYFGTRLSLETEHSQRIQAELRTVRAREAAKDAALQGAIDVLDNCSVGFGPYCMCERCRLCGETRQECEAKGECSNHHMHGHCLLCDIDDAIEECKAALATTPPAADAGEGAGEAERLRQLQIEYAEVSVADELASMEDAREQKLPLRKRELLRELCRIADPARYENLPTISDLYGIWAEHGPGPSEEEVAENRRVMWGEAEQRPAEREGRELPQLQPLPYPYVDGAPDDGEAD